MSSAAATVDLYTFSDADYTQAFRWKTSTDPAPETYFDFTGNELMMMVRHHTEDIEAFLSLSTDQDGGIVLSAAQGDPTHLTIINITITRAQLALVPVGEHAHSLIMVRPDGLRADLWRGTLTHAIGPTR